MTAYSRWRSRKSRSRLVDSRLVRRRDCSDLDCRLLVPRVWTTCHSHFHRSDSFRKYRLENGPYAYVSSSESPLTLLSLSVKREKKSTAVAAALLVCLLLFVFFHFTKWQLFVVARCPISGLLT